MTQTGPRLKLPDWTPEELETQRERRREAIDGIRAVRKRILARNRGVPIDVDAALDEMRGRTPVHD